MGVGVRLKNGGPGVRLKDKASVTRPVSAPEPEVYPDRIFFEIGNSKFFADPHPAGGLTIWWNSALKPEVYFVALEAETVQHAVIAVYAYQAGCKMGFELGKHHAQAAVRLALGLSQ